MILESSLFLNRLPTSIIELSLQNWMKQTQRGNLAVNEWTVNSNEVVESPMVHDVIET